MLSIRTLFVIIGFYISSSCILAQEHHSTTATAPHAPAHAAPAAPHAEGTAAAHATHEGGEGEFNVAEMILHHIADANEFHVGPWTIPLPCIIYKDGKLDMFSSSVFEHGHKEYNGYKLEHGRVKTVDGSKFTDLSITKNVFTMLLAALVLCLIFFSVAAAYRKRPGQAPKGLQSVFEPLIAFVSDDIAKANIGEKKYMKYVPYLLTLFFFILANNLLGLVPFFPGGGNVTGNIAVTLVLSVITFIMVNVSGSKDYWGHIFWMPGVPLILKPLMAILEFIGIFTKPFALMIRLFANISAGHIIILSLVSLIFIFGKMGQSPAGVAGGVAVTVPFVLFMNAIELFVAFLQAYIFTMLSALFIGMAVEEHHHAEEHH